MPRYNDPPTNREMEYMTAGDPTEREDRLLAKLEAAREELRILKDELSGWLDGKSQEDMVDSIEKILRDTDPEAD